MVHVLVASDKFKGTLTAAQVGHALTVGIGRVRPDATVTVVPVADGGDGTLAAALAAGCTEVEVTASGPTGLPRPTRYARTGDLAVVELAEVCGLDLLQGTPLAPMTATSRGVGEAIAHAVTQGCRHIVLGIGGSASTDGGAGMVAALGARLLGADGHDVPDGGAALAGLHTLQVDRLHQTLAGIEVTVACDVTNPLLGPSGAAVTYGPQKGADAQQVRALDAALAHWADLVAATTGTDARTLPGAGAAGGVGFAALALLGATMRPGIEVVFELVGFDAALRGADLVVTGEGSLDEQTLHGKAPTGVARAARAAGVPVVAVCGRSTLTDAALAEVGISHAYQLTDIEADLARCMTDAATLVEVLGERIAAEHLSAPPTPGRPR
jgi:glycerate kinase